MLGKKGQSNRGGNVNVDGNNNYKNVDINMREKKQNIVVNKNDEIINNNNSKNIDDDKKIDVIKEGNLPKRNVNIFVRRDMKKDIKQ